MTPSSNCYELLGVSPSANNAELRKAFRQLSKRLHPDTTSLPSDEATRQFQNVCEAYDLLSDPVLRANYDLFIEKENNLISQTKEPSLTKIKPVDFSKSIGVRRPLSGGELFSLLLLIISIFLSLALGVFIAFLRRGNLEFTPSWLM
ncbi:J domain-containing protein [Prochlorococcus marinus]|uniref:Molecular chaperone DnaJ n=1 Tax=Prochlorococcus marinus XMU1408 TaxID=2213228 RepID=A0A318R1K2_PROMR|nr:J domain-containing protein [Prochlorococcus marinus]MBW3042648.1 molecular chaperone DnaJ [Prochlorococcus marinus str. XMU1408]PYE01343.1 molecular chaperone DnaJ [Prochlorococcus marinus XMU1408]